MAEISDQTHIFLDVLDRCATDQLIQPVLDLSNTIFEAEFDKSDFSHHTLTEWRSRLDDAQANIICMRTEAHSRRPVGFFFTYPKLQPEIGFDTYHIWLAGIDATCRGHHLFGRMFEETKARALRSGFDHLSVCTIPTRFTAMYRILQKHGWEFVTWREDRHGRKALMKLKIS